MNPIRQPFRTRKDAFALHSQPRVGNSSWVLEIVIDNPSIPPVSESKVSKTTSTTFGLCGPSGVHTSQIEKSPKIRRSRPALLGIFISRLLADSSGFPRPASPRSGSGSSLQPRTDVVSLPPNVSDRLLCGFLFDHGFLLFSEPETLSWIRDPTWPKWADGLHRGSAVGIPEVDSRSLRSLCSHEWKALLLGISRDTLFHTKNTEAAQRLDTGSNTKGNDSSGRSTT